MQEQNIGFSCYCILYVTVLFMKQTIKDCVFYPSKNSVHSIFAQIFKEEIKMFEQDDEKYLLYVGYLSMIAGRTNLMVLMSCININISKVTVQAIKV